MTTTLSSKGQVVLPRIARNRLRLVPGTKLTCEVQGDAIVLKPMAARPVVHETVIDKVSGLRVTKKTRNAPVVTSDMVKALMADFP